MIGIGQDDARNAEPLFKKRNHRGPPLAETAE
jgi:hypothetical protein